jgi:hypothetical protein
VFGERTGSLAERFSEENLWTGIRREALAYFDARAIDWHGRFKRFGPMA